MSGPAASACGARAKARHAGTAYATPAALSGTGSRLKGPHARDTKLETTSLSVEADHVPFRVAGAASGLN